MNSIMEEALQETGTARKAPEPEPAANIVAAPAKTASANPQDDFLRMLRLSNLDSFSMSDDQRDTFIDMAENLGLDPGEAEDLVDLYLEEADEKSMAAPPTSGPKIELKSGTAHAEDKPSAPK